MVDCLCLGLFMVDRYLVCLFVCLLLYFDGFDSVGCFVCFICV